MNHSFISPSSIVLDQATVDWSTSLDSHIVQFRAAGDSQMRIFLTDADARALHAALGASIAAVTE